MFDIPIWGTKKWGFVDTKGNVVVKPIFDRVNGVGEGSLCFTFDPQKSFHEGLAAIAVGKLWGFIDKTGQIVIKPQFKSVGNFSDGLACVQIDQKCGFIDHAGKLVIPATFDPHALFCGFMFFQDGLCPAEQYPWAMGYINKLGKYVIKPENSCCRPFSEGLGAISSSNKSGRSERQYFIDKTGKSIFEVNPGKYTGTIVIGSFSEGRALITAYTNEAHAEQRCWFIDKTGGKISQEFQKAEDFSEGLAAVMPIGLEQYGYINYRGQIVIQPMFDQPMFGKVGSFHEGLAAAALKESDKEKKFTYKWGYIDKSGTWKIQPKFDQAGSFFDGLAIVRMKKDIGGSEGFIDKTGNLVIPAKYNLACPFSEGLAAVN